MDFCKSLFERNGHGRYERLVLPEGVKPPPFFLAYRADPSDSGRIHSDVRARYVKGNGLLACAGVYCLNCALTTVAVRRCLLP